MPGVTRDGAHESARVSAVSRRRTTTVWTTRLLEHVETIPARPRSVNPVVPVVYPRSPRRRTRVVGPADHLVRKWTYRLSIKRPFWGGFGPDSAQPVRRVTYG